MPYLTNEEYFQLESEAQENLTLRAERDNLAAANAELREALGKIANFDVEEESGFVDEWTQANAFTVCQYTARAVLAKGAK